MSAAINGIGTSKLRVETEGSDAVAEADRGEFSMSSSGTGTVVVAARQGSVHVSAQQKTVTVSPGEQSVVTAGLPPTTPAAVPPALFLKVHGPKSAVQSDTRATISGTSVPGAIVSINGVHTAANERGEFSAIVPLNEGKNQIHVDAQDVLGRREQAAVADITVKSRVDKVTSKARWTSETDDNDKSAR